MIQKNVTVIFSTNKNKEPQLQFYINDEAPIQMLAFTDVDLSDYNGTFSSQELSTEYTFKEVDGTLIASHPRLDDIKFSPIQKDIFTSKNRTYKKLEFVRDLSSNIIGLNISNERVRNLWFDKIEL